MAYLANARALGKRWRSYLGLLAVLGAAEAVLVLVPAFPFRQFYAGFVLGAAMMAVALSAARFDDPQMRGHLAEQFSLDKLRKVRGWLIIDNLPFDHLDVDHVAVTPSGVLAVESKYHGRALPAADASRKRHDLAAAHAAARKINSFLRSKKLLDGTGVTPVLVIWGAGAPELDEGYVVVDGVHVVDGDHPELWSHRFNAPLLSPERRAALHQAFADYLRLRQQHSATNQQSLRSRMCRAFRDGVGDARDERAALQQARMSARRRHRATS